LALNFLSCGRLKKQGASIVSVVYDLIHAHPQFCDAGLTKVFERWLTGLPQQQMDLCAYRKPCRAVFSVLWRNGWATELLASVSLNIFIWVLNLISCSVIH
jgi:hypothetical protein